MTPAARVQTSIELLDAIIAAARGKGAPADRILADWFRNNRFAGSKDRRAIRELVYAAIRACGPVPETGRAAMLRLAELDESIAPLFDGSTYGPAPIGKGEGAARGGVAPAWLEERLAGSGIAGPEAEALLERAPLDLRVNTLKADRARLELPAEFALTDAPHGLRLEAGTPVEQWPAFREGQIEVQDTGSQLACLAVAAQPGETVIDLCAGGGGKTLALAAAMDNQGRLIASDTDRNRLARLAPRAERAGAANIETILLDPQKELDALAEFAGQADAVLIDAPCSGTGTWRRNPEARWRLDEKELARLGAVQAHLLDVATRLVKPGGRIVYVTCSLLDEEGAGQIDAFLMRHPQLAARELALPLGRKRGQGTRLSPFHDGTDGFFIACAG
ncbi:RsmB/NOP family class I SAM-dependent RNA methyltransferase [Erythrobacter sp.]|uniref:RsmB/NOP family class I SAM-dependent RNA methyltransferase n=1 Tax=Erythrobacter sp. TaxID=1042 RepID=UPI001B1E274F|nr:RsmB/NOP family class I SAM-dependent RNA methyltransferase [Erythrobacter sp.]MBO6526206.1 RsmB/NOP family class I SAM-dependent RNA methyltransferase [Erythrobacter sp.]MBO6530459.1 RsmB/NOP family class I SAM-dependent RNA methyltransferase [Erythrobacter sp.]